MKKAEHYRPKKLLLHIKMVKETITFGDSEIENITFCCYKSPIFFKEDVDIDKVLVSSKISSDQKNHKYYMGYSYDYFK